MWEVVTMLRGKLVIFDPCYIETVFFLYPRSCYAKIEGNDCSSYAQMLAK